MDSSFLFSRSSASLEIGGNATESRSLCLENKVCKIRVADDFFVFVVGICREALRP